MRREYRGVSTLEHCPPAAVLAYWVAAAGGSESPCGSQCLPCKSVRPSVQCADRRRADGGWWLQAKRSGPLPMLCCAVQGTLAIGRCRAVSTTRDPYQLSSWSRGCAPPGSNRKQATSVEGSALRNLGLSATHSPDGAVQCIAVQCGALLRCASAGRSLRICLVQPKCSTIWNLNFIVNVSLDSSPRRDMISGLASAPASPDQRPAEARSHHAPPRPKLGGSLGARTLGAAFIMT